MNIYQIFKKLNQLLLIRYKKKYFLLVSFMIINNIIQVSSFLSIIPFISYLADPDSANILVDLIIKYQLVNNNSIIWFLAFFSIFFLLFGAIISIIAIYLEKIFGYTFLTRTKEDLFQYYLSKDYAFFLEENTADITATLINDVERLGVNMIFPYLRAISSLIIITTFFLVLLFLYPLITFFLIIFFPTIYLTIYLVVRKKLSLNSEIILKKYHSSVQTILETFPLIKEIKLYNLENVYDKFFLRDISILGQTHASNQIISEIPKFITETLGFVVIILFCLSLYSLSNTFNSIIPTISLFIIIGYKTLPSIQLIFSSVSLIRGNTSALESIAKKAKFLFEVDPKDEVEQSNQDLEDIEFKKYIKLSNIEFQYNKNENVILNNLSLKINKNKFIGIQGPSGVGKSSLINIILGLLKADKGTFEIDNRSFSAKDYFSSKKIKQLFAYVPQNVFFLDDTIAKNIALGDHEIDFVRIRNVCELIGIGDFISKLPNKELTVIGENAIRLSGGQKQRIAIARALYRDPSIIVFDESTSSLDDFNQELVLNIVSELKKIKTIIFISHSSKVIEYCDEVYKLDSNTLRKI